MQTMMIQHQALINALDMGWEIEAPVIQKIIPHVSSRYRFMLKRMTDEPTRILEMVSEPFLEQWIQTHNLEIQVIMEKPYGHTFLLEQTP